MKPTLAIVFVVLALTSLAALRARGEDAPEKIAPRDAVASLMRALQRNKGAVRIGMTVTGADRETKGAANHLDTRYLPLKGSWLDKKGRLEGILSWDVDLDKGTKVDTIRAILVTDPFDKKEMGKTIAAVGKELGLRLAPDSEDPDTWFDENATGVEIWVTLGECVVVIEAEVLI